MAAGGFLRRWAARKAESGARARRAGRQSGAGPAASPPAAPPAGQEKPPTLEDVRQLAQDADYSRFLARGIDPAVRRAALKTLFSDPHFRRMDGLDVYIGDYTRHEPLTPAMLAALQHARRAMGRADEAREQEAANGTAAADKAVQHGESGENNENNENNESGPIAQEQSATSPGPASVQDTATP